MVCLIVLSLSLAMLFVHSGSEVVRVISLIGACGCSLMATAAWLRMIDRVQYLESRVEDLERINRVRGRKESDGN